MTATTVVAWNGSAQSRAALLWAIEREQSGLGGLLLLTVIDDAFRSCGQAAMDELLVAGQQALDAEEAWIRLAAPTILVTARLLRGEPENEIMRNCPVGSMLAVGQREGPSPSQRWSFAARLASEAAVPVVIVEAGPVRDRAGVIVGVDGSPASHEASLVAAAEAQRRHEPLHAVHAWPGATHGLASESHLDDLHAEHQGILDSSVSVISDAFPSLPVEGHLDPGPADSVLRRRAQDAALLVVGSRGHGAVRRFLLGSVSRSLILSATCPLVIVTVAPVE